MNRKNWNKWFVLLKESVWTFPLLLLAVFAILTILRISGSSVGAYHQQLYGVSQKDPNLIANKPQGIRSDEWELNTPMTVSQVRNNFPRINHDIGQGQDMSLVLDVPYKDWSTAFKPQNWSFFILPLEMAFAAKWWLLAYLLTISCYFFCVYLLPRKHLLAAIVSIGVLCSPFVQWWYQTITLAPLFYSFFMALIVMYLIDHKEISKLKSVGLYGLLTYLLVCFGLLLYPPFQVPCAIVLAIFLLGYGLNKINRNELKRFVFMAAYMLIVGIVAAGVLLAFVKTRSDAVDALRNTAYPGMRVQTSGGFGKWRLLESPLLINMQSSTKALGYPANQSEASNFISLTPFLLPAAAFLIYIGKIRKQRFDWVLIGLVALYILLLIRMIVPGALEPLFQLAQLGLVPHTRLLIGLGLLGIILMIVMMNRLQNMKDQLPMLLRWGSALLAFTVCMIVGLNAIKLYPIFFSNKLELLVISLTLAAIIYLLLSKRFVLSMLTLTALSLASVVFVTPLYRGLGPLTDDSLATAVRSIGDKQGKWLVTDEFVFENYASQNGLGSLSGTYTYPQENLWKPLATTQSDTDTYNRFAHVQFKADETVPAEGQGARLELTNPDSFLVRFNSCSEFLRDQQVRYIIATTKINSPCVRTIKTITYPKMTFTVYSLVD